MRENEIDFLWKMIFVLIYWTILKVAWKMMLFTLKAKSIFKSICFCFDVKAKSKAKLCFFALLFTFRFCFAHRCIQRHGLFDLLSPALIPLTHVYLFSALNTDGIWSFDLMLWWRADVLWSKLVTIFSNLHMSLKNSFFGLTDELLRSICSGS